MKVSGWDTDAWVEDGVKVSSADLESYLCVNYTAAGADEMLGVLVKPPKTQKKEEDGVGAVEEGADDDDDGYDFPVAYVSFPTEEYANEFIKKSKGKLKYEDHEKLKAELIKNIEDEAWRLKYNSAGKPTVERLPWFLHDK